VKNLIPLAALICLLSTLGAAATESQNEVLQFDLGAGWKDVSHTESGKRHTVTFIREGDDAAHWKERVTYMYGANSRGQRPPRQEAEDIQKFTEKTFRHDLVDFNIIAADETSVLYEFHTKWSAQTHEQHVITRIVHSQHNWFDLSYVTREPEFGADQRAQWIKTLTDATVKTAQP
jgi:hypothetical protein